MERSAGAPPTTLALTDDRATDPRTCGHKAATLASLSKAGFPCVGGTVIPAWIHQRQQTQDGAATEFANALDEIIGTFGESRLAVRSSGVVEDTAEASYAGIYTSVLDVCGLDELRAAVLRCWASAANVSVYRGEGATGDPPVAVLVQRLLEPDAAGAAFAQDPTSDVVGAVSVSAVRGRADRLMQGETSADEWTVASGAATRAGDAVDAISAGQAVAIAELTRRISTFLGYPAEVEWALLGSEIVVLQARPMTAGTARVVTWPAPSRGEWRRDIRLGEWLPEPVTPLFATWVLPEIDRRFRHMQWQRSGVLVPAPSYRLINGWYYHSPLGDRRSSVLLRGMVTHPVFACSMLAGRRWPWITNRLVVEREIAAFERNWPRRYRDLVATLGEGFDAMPARDVLTFVERVIELVSQYVWPMIVVGGAAWRVEHALARYYEKHLLPELNVPYHGLLVAPGPADDRVPHAVFTLDWYRPTLGEVFDGAPPPPASPTDDEAGRLERRCLAVLRRRQLRPERFTRLLTLARVSARRRRQYTMNLTRPWPILRQALHRLGAELTDRGVLACPEHLYFLTSEELRDALAEPSAVRGQDLAAERTREWKHQCGLRPPPALGTVACLLPLLLARPAPEASDSTGVLRGFGVSPGRATGRARLLDPMARTAVRPGDVVVVRSLVPALAPLIRNVGAIAAEAGSVAAHMSVIAREHGVPAVIGLHAVTDAVQDGDLITVDGTTGCVHLGGAAL
jgi:rifampicin phosphotransferase